MNWVVENKEWLFSGIGIFVIGLIINHFSKSKTNEKTELIDIKTNISPVNNNNNNNNNTNNINLNIASIENNIDKVNNAEKNSINRDALIDSLKPKIKILFIDDDKKFNIVKIFKDSKWKNTQSVQDIKSVDDLKVKEADIIFVDINGVGKLLECKDDGLDIALMLKQKYPNKKIIIYSANKNNDNFHPAWDSCDFKLEKNALSYQYLSLVEQYSLELYSY